MPALEQVWRDEWGRLLALLVARYRRLDLAEDGLADAFEAATRTWPRDGTPANPAGWLLTAARNRILDRLRAEAVHARKLPILAVEANLTEEAQRVMADVSGQGSLPGQGPGYDERLRLVLLCAHPSLARESAAALTLRLVMGIATEDIARLFLVPTATMAARLTRARKRLARESFGLPDGPDLEARLALAADVAYLAFTAGYAPGSGDDVLRPEQAAEAIRLARVLREVAPAHAELDSLLALMLLQHSRRDARVDSHGGLVLLPDQDRERWHHAEIDEAVALLTPWTDAPGTLYLLQALIAAEHAIAGTAADTNWPRVAGRYLELEQLTGSPVVRLNRAIAVAEADGPHAGLALLEGLELAGHRLPGARGQLLLRAGRVEEGRAELARAVELCGNEAERAHLRQLLTVAG